MLLSDRELEEAGEKLLDPPSSVDQILSILDKVVDRISNVEQSPPHSTMSALNPLIGAFFAPKLLRHSDVDVKVAVAACISQITRINAPDLTYDDDQMKEVSQLIVSSFQHLSDIYSRSYAKRILILETVSGLKLCNVMLDLECDDALLLEMFQHFLKGIRNHHPVKVFFCMENIMTLVLEESDDDKPPEILSPILHYVKKDDKKIPRVSRKLAEHVLINCASKLKTYLAEAVKSSGVSLDKYSNVVASICEGAFSALKQNAVVDHRKEDHQATREVAIKDKQKAAEVSTSITSTNENGHEAVSPQRETVAEEEDPAESETRTPKRARVGESCRFHEAHHGETEKTAHKSGPEPVDLQCKKLPQPCSFTHQLAKVKQSIVDTITSVGQFRSELETKKQSIVDTLTSVRQFRSEMKKKEDNLETWLEEFDVLGM